MNRMRVPAIASVMPPVKAMVVRVGRVVLRRRVIVSATGVMVIASAGVMLHIEPLIGDRVVWELLAYSVHAVGMLPFLKPLEGFWDLMGD